MRCSRNLLPRTMTKSSSVRIVAARSFVGWISIHSAERWPQARRRCTSARQARRTATSRAAGRDRDPSASCRAAQHWRPRSLRSDSRFPHEPVVPAEDENPFVVDGGRYSENRRLGICDLCDRVDVPCVTVPAAEDQSSTGACEACVLRMLRAFVRDRATHIQLAVPDVAAVDAAGGRFIPNVRSEEDPKEGR